ncbi:MAG: hypothetical protein JO001_17930 [Alphaproteobacteria bacterium]|nr:hypothetical protein [Alphaproteobacteria bacterium]
MARTTRSQSIELRVVELMAARLCHDLIGPVAAINNGVELLEEEDGGFMREAIGLVGDSARTASRRLQFFRFAYGFSGIGMTGTPPHQLAADFFTGGNIECHYPAELRDAEPAWQKLACALLPLAAEALPRGGRLSLTVAEPGLEIAATGANIGPSPEIRDALTLVTPVAELTSRIVGGYFAGLLADRLGWRIVVEDRHDGFRLAAVP